MAVHSRPYPDGLVQPDGDRYLATSGRGPLTHGHRDAPIAVSRIGAAVRKEETALLTARYRVGDLAPAGYRFIE